MATRSWLRRRRAVRGLAVAGGDRRAPQAPRRPRPPDPPRKIEIRAQPITGFDARDPSRRQFGELLFPRRARAHLARTRSSAESPLIDVAADGARFIAASDKEPLVPRPHPLSRRGRPASPTPRWRRCSGPTAGRSPRAAGTTPKPSPRTATRSMSGFERVHQILRFDYGKDGLLARGQPIAVPPAFKRCPATGASNAWSSSRKRLAARRHADRDLRARRSTLPATSRRS